MLLVFFINVRVLMMTAHVEISVQLLLLLLLLPLLAQQLLLLPANC